LPRVHRSGSAAAGPSDEALVAAIRNADEPAFGLLYERYVRRLYAFSLQRLRDHADAEEAVQETFASVFRSIEAYRGDSPLSSWIYGIARNTVNNCVRRRDARQRRMARARDELARARVAAPPRTPEDELSLRRSLGRLGECLASMSAWQAEIFALRHVENLPIAEIARRTARSHNAVRCSLYRVKSLLIEAVGPRASDLDRGGVAQRSASSSARSVAGGSRSEGARGARRPM